MPILRRNSSKERKQSSSHSDESGINPSLFERLRRRSSASDNHRHRSSHDGGQSADLASPEVTPTPRDHDKTSSTGSTTESIHSRSQAHQKSSPHSASTPGHHDTATEAEHVQGDLTKDDVQHLFSGAPHFMLEKGRRGRYFPQVYFPWNNQLDITDLQDRPYLKHESFALSSMHAHLPVPDEVNWKPEKGILTGSTIDHSFFLTVISMQYFSLSDLLQGMPHPSASVYNPSETGKRPMFDLGIYERPNMLGITGIEISTMALRAYLERPVADGLQQATSHELGDGADTIDQSRSPGTELNLEHMSASEAFKALAHEGGEAKIGKHAPKQDRIDLMRGGAKAWKSVGVRDVSMDAIANRLCYMNELRQQVVSQGWRYTVLNILTEAQLGDYLFSELLFPPSKIIDGKSKNHDLKVQIEALVKVLTTPGVWLDFSMPRERILFVQALYATRKEDQHGKDHHGITPEEKRKWNLIQLLLALELVIRVDAALRLGVAMHEIEIAPKEMHHFNKLRNLKVDWDLVIARRFLDLCYAKKIPFSPPAMVEGTPPEKVGSPPQTPHTEHHRFLDKFKHSLSFTGKEQQEPKYTLAILPRQPRMMGEGLIHFGRHINWPTIDSVKDALTTKLAVAEEQKEEMLARGVEPLQHKHIAAHDLDNACVELRSASEATVGGPLSHGWLGGLIIPGFLSCDLLMCTLLENDVKGRPLDALGPKAWPRAGFVWGGRSWWSKACVAGLVMAPSEGTVERMGWMALPEVATPFNAKTGNVLGDGWVLIRTFQAKNLREGYRILDGDALSKESSPLGIGHGKVSSTEFGMVTDDVLNSLPTLEVAKVQLIMEELDSAGESKEKYPEKEKYSAAVLADLAEGENRKPQSMVIPLRYDVRFVAGHPCRPPHGHATAPQSEGEHKEPVHKHLEHLPAHPLHKSYKFVVKSVAEVLELEATDWLPDPHDKEAGSVWIVDARGTSAKEERGQSGKRDEPEGRGDDEGQTEGEEDTVTTPRAGQGGQGGKREILMRAWCAKVGREAIVSRVGRQCFGCAVREARALEIGIVIRVGELLN